MYFSAIPTLQVEINTSLILRRSRSLAVTHFLPSPSDGLHSRSFCWRHDAVVLSTNQIECNIFSEIRNFRNVWKYEGNRALIENLARKCHFCPFLRSLAIGSRRKRASWRHEHDLEWSPSDGEGRECVTASDLDRLRIRLDQYETYLHIQILGTKMDEINNCWTTPFLR